MVVDRESFQNAGMAGPGPTQVPHTLESQGMNDASDARREGILRRFEAIEAVHDHVLNDLKECGADFITRFKSTMLAEPKQPYKFRDGQQLDWELVTLPRRNG